MVCKPTLHPLALQHLREIRERWGVEPTIEEAIWIVRLCERVLCPCEGERSDLCGIPVRCGVSSVFLWPLSIGAAVWFQDYASKWWGNNPERLTMALGFALAHGRDRDVMRSVAAGREIAEQAIKAWAAGLTCTREELEAAFDDVLPAIGPQDGRRSDTAAKLDWEQLVGEIEAVTGIPSDHWLWDMSKEATLRAWDRSRAVMTARSCGSTTGASALEPLNIALQELAEAKAHIINAHKQELGQ